MSADRPIGYRRFSDGTTRPVFLDQDGRQYIFSDGRPVHGTWLDQRRQDQTDDPVPIIGGTVFPEHDHFFLAGSRSSR